jgi:acrylyl-CoA reductase (NADPH)
MKNYKSLIVEKVNNNYIKKFKTNFFEELSKGEVLIKVQYSSLNYKDYLVCNGKFWDCRKYPLVPGIDASGIIVKSNSKKLKKGNIVSVIATPAGSKIPGGFAEYIKISERWVEKLPNNISPKKAMILGTAGFSAMFIVNKILKKKIINFKRVAISGSSGGVGSILINCLSKLSYEITAYSSSKKNYKLLRKIGAKNIKEIGQIGSTSLSLQKKEYDYVIDSIGGNFLSYVLKKINDKGTIFSIGFANTQEISNINLAPFILRSIKLEGIHTESLSKKHRLETWRFISKYLKTNKIHPSIYKEIKFSKIINEIRNFNKSKFGRKIVNINS